MYKGMGNGHPYLGNFAYTGHPWEMAKGFDTSLALGEFIPKDKIPDPHRIELQCKVNNELRQKVGKTNWSALSTLFGGQSSGGKTNFNRYSYYSLLVAGFNR